VPVPRLILLPLYRFWWCCLCSAVPGSILLPSQSSINQKSLSDSARGTTGCATLLAHLRGGPERDPRGPLAVQQEGERQDRGAKLLEAEVGRGREERGRRGAAQAQGRQEHDHRPEVSAHRGPHLARLRGRQKEIDAFLREWREHACACGQEGREVEPGAR